MRFSKKLRISGTIILLAAAFGTANKVSAETLSRQEIYNKDGIKVTVTKLEKNFTETEIKMLFENNSENNVCIQARDLSVNGYVTDPMMSVDINSGKKVNDSLGFFTDDFEAKGIDIIADIEFSLHIFEEETWNTIDDSDPVLLVTEGNENYIQEYDDSGEVLYENNGIRIIAKGLSDGFMGPELCLYAENNSDRNVSIYADDTSVNGFMIGAVMSIELPRGKHNLDEMTFFDSDLEENGIESIEEIETIFCITDSDTLNTIDETDVIQLSLK